MELLRRLAPLPATAAGQLLLLALLHSLQLYLQLLWTDRWACGAQHYTESVA